jgi:tetratricopeptide (TPR) repeat protein
MSCHNGFPTFARGSENKFLNLPNGIDCERCHGPGSIHVRRKSNGEVIDTSKYIDYSIVNPGKLSVNLQFDICQRCHLQGNAILKPGKSFYDFRPGNELKDYWTVFLPKYSGAEDEFIMASHADRLKMSPCFMNTTMKVKESNSLRPYKDAMTCVTCHNPHISVKETGKEIFNTACKNCHTAPKHVECSADMRLRMKKDDNCVSCHMPRSGSIDIPHVTVTDHYIRKPVTQEQKEKMKKFIGLYAINEQDPSDLVRAQGYINQYEKFELQPVYLDSAKYYLDKAMKTDPELVFPVLVQFHFIRLDYKSIIALAEKSGGLELLNTKLTHTSWDNQDAWTCYRIGESYRSQNEYPKADKYLSRAIELSPFNQEFQNKYAVTLVSLSKFAEAKKVFEYIIKEDPDFAPAWSNLGYLYLLKDDFVKAEELYNKALYLDPDYIQALVNKASLLYAQKRTKELKELVLRMKKRYPANPQVNAMVKDLNL